MSTPKKGHPLTLAHQCALGALHALCELRDSLRIKCPYSTPNQRIAWQLGQICRFTRFLPSNDNFSSVQSWFGNGDPVQFLDEFGASAHQVAIKVMMAVWKRIDGILVDEYLKVHGERAPFKIEDGGDFFSSSISAIWTATSWDALRRNIKVKIQDLQYFHAKLEAEYDSAWRFLVTAPDLRKAIIAEMEGRPIPNSTFPPARTERLRIDVDSGSATLDAQHFQNIDQNALRALKSIADAKKVIKIKDARKTIGCNHDRTFQRWIERLPPPLRSCAVGVSGSGMRLVLPDLESMP